MKQIELRTLRTLSGLSENAIDQDDFEEEANWDHLPSIAVAKDHVDDILAAAQKVYDSWDEEPDVYFNGGICHLIADAICEVLGRLGVECATVSSSHEQHVYVAGKFQEGVVTIDISPYTYETGGGFTWQKTPDVEFGKNDVEFYHTSSDPAEFDSYVGDW